MEPGKATRGSGMSDLNGPERRAVHGLADLCFLISGEKNTARTVLRGGVIEVVIFTSEEGCRRLEGREGRMREALRRITSALSGRLHREFRLSFSINNTELISSPEENNLWITQDRT